VVGERSAERAAASSLRTAVVAEEVAGIRRIVVAVEEHHILRTEADRSLAVEGCSVSVTRRSHRSWQGTDGYCCWGGYPPYCCCWGGGGPWP